MRFPAGKDHSFRLRSGQSVSEGKEVTLDHVWRLSTAHGFSVRSLDFQHFGRGQPDVQPALM